MGLEKNAIEDGYKLVRNAIEMGLEYESTCEGRRMLLEYGTREDVIQVE